MGKNDKFREVLREVFQNRVVSALNYVVLKWYCQQ